MNHQGKGKWVTGQRILKLQLVKSWWRHRKKQNTKRPCVQDKGGIGSGWARGLDQPPEGVWVAVRKFTFTPHAEACGVTTSSSGCAGDVCGLRFSCSCPVLVAPGK